MPTALETPMMAAMLRAALADLKQTLQEAATAAVATFERQTGMTPSRLEIEMIDINPDGHQPHFIVGGVRVRLEDV